MTLGLVYQVCVIVMIDPCRRDFEPRAVSDIMTQTVHNNSKFFLFISFFLILLSPEVNRKLKNMKYKMIRVKKDIQLPIEPTTGKSLPFLLWQVASYW